MDICFEGIDDGKTSLLADFATLRGALLLGVVGEGLGGEVGMRSWGDGAYEAARGGPRFETRPDYPVRHGEKLRARKSVVVHLEVAHHDGRPHVPVTRLLAAG